MRAIAIVPGRSGSVHLRDVPRPSLDSIADGRGVRVRMVRVGLCGTDADLADGHYGRAPDGADHLVIGHESLGRAVEVGAEAAEAIEPGRLVVLMVRRPDGSGEGGSDEGERREGGNRPGGHSSHDRMGQAHPSTDDAIIEAGIARQDGFMAEEVVDDVRWTIPLPDVVEDVGVLTEPLSCVVKALRQSREAQARLFRWDPVRSLVLGAGTIGLLATLALRQQGLEVTSFARRRPPYRNSELVEALGARYVSAADSGIGETIARHGPFDLVFEASGAPELFEPAVAALAPNGVLALFSVTPGSRRLEVDVASLNQAMVLGDRAMIGSSSATREDYLEAVRVLERARRDPATQGWLPRLITGRIAGLDPDAIAAHLADDGDDIKVTVEIAGPTD